MAAQASLNERAAVAGRAANPAPRVDRAARSAVHWAELMAHAEHDSGQRYGSAASHFRDWAERDRAHMLADFTPKQRGYVKLKFAQAYGQARRELDRKSAVNPETPEKPATTAEAKKRFPYTKSVMFDDAARDFTRSTKWFTSQDGYPVAVSYSGMTVYFFNEDGYVAGRFGLPHPLHAADQAKVQALAGARSNPANPSASNPDDRDPAVIGYYLINKRGARFAGSPDNATSRYKLGDGRQVSVSWDGWEVSGNQHFAPKSGSGVHSLNDWLVNEPARQSARELAEQETKERLRKERKVSLASAAVQKFIKKLADGMELAGGGPTTITPGSSSALFPEVIVYNESVGRKVIVRLDDGSYHTSGVNGKQPKKLFDYLAKYGEWGKVESNPAVSAAQYRLAQAVLSGSAKGKQTMTKAVAREIVDTTPARDRSSFMQKANPLPQWIEAYTDELLKAVQAGEIPWARNDSPEVATRLRDWVVKSSVSFANNTKEFAISGVVKRTAKRLGIKPTYKAIQEYIRQESNPRDTARANPSIAGSRTTVVTPDGKVKYVKNLGWVIRNWSKIDRLTWETTGPGSSGVFRADMRDGSVYSTNYADFGVFRKFVNRPVFKGLDIYIDGKRYKVGDAEFSKLRASYERGNGMKKANPITLHVDNSEQANWSVKALKFLGYTGARKEVHKGKRTSYGYGLAPSREADTVYVFGGDQGISSDDADAIYHLLFHTQTAGMSSGSLQTVERLREKFTSKNGVNLIPARRKANPSSSNPTHKDPGTMTAGEINKELDKLDALSSKHTDEMISSGRGHERPTDWWGKTDPLSLAMRQLSDRRSDLRNEIERRYGPGAPSRLPKGFGPRKHPDGTLIQFGEKRRRKAINPASSADTAFERFHGQPPGETISITKDEHYHHHLAAIGTLLGLCVRVPDGKGGHYDNRIEFSGVFLCTNEDGTQLFLEGGDQSLDLDSLHLNPKLTRAANEGRESLIIGEVWLIGYHTEKDFDDFRPTDYIHGFGPEEYHRKVRKGGDLWDDAEPPKDKIFGTGVLPALRYDTVNQALHLDGGIYKIPLPALETSPGIVD